MAPVMMSSILGEVIFFFLKTLNFSSHHLHLYQVAQDFLKVFQTSLQDFL